jgi:hypothetical protein
MSAPLAAPSQCPLLASADVVDHEGRTYVVLRHEGGVLAVLELVTRTGQLRTLSCWPKAVAAGPGAAPAACRFL